MAFLDLFNPALDFVFGPLLSLDPLLAVALMSALVSLLISVIYKYTTDQNLMKQLRDEMNELQKEAKELRDHPEKALAVQKQMMETNMKYMMQSMRSTLFTMLPIILIFGWMSGHFAYEPLAVEDRFTVSATFSEEAGTITLMEPEGIALLSDANNSVKGKKAFWTLAGKDPGEHLLSFAYKEGIYTLPVTIIEKDGKRTYTPTTKTIGKDGLESLEIAYQKLAILPYLGWGWLGTYILFSIISSMLFRKWMKIY